MNSFAYHKPQNIGDAVELLRTFGKDARILAGGTDLLVRIKNQQTTPKVVVDLKGIASLNIGIVREKDAFHIGALTLMASLDADQQINTYFPALAEAAASVGSVQIRNRATLGGNLCNASPAADTAPALLIYDASVKVVGSKLTRVIPLTDFILGPGKTALKVDEIVETILIPIPLNEQAASFDRLARRRGVDLATINVCCQIFKSGLTRFAIGAAAPVPFIVEDVSHKLTDPSIKESEKTVIIQKLMEKASPITDVRASQEYRQAMLVVLGKRTLKKSLERLTTIQ